MIVRTCDDDTRPLCYFICAELRLSTYRITFVSRKGVFLDFFFIIMSVFMVYFFLKISSCLDGLLCVRVCLLTVYVCFMSTIIIF